MENFIYARSFRDLLVYKQAFIVSRRIFTLSKGFPEEEKYALTSQIRRASRSIGANITELGRSEGMNDILSANSPTRMASKWRHNIGRVSPSLAVILTNQQLALWWKILNKLVGYCKA